MERETKELIVGEHKLIVNTYLTGREIRDIQSSMLSKVEMEQKGGETKMSGFSGEMIAVQEDHQIRAVVKSFDGVVEGIVDLILDLRAEQYEEVMAYVKSIAEKKGQASK